MANCYTALDLGVEVVPVLNKMDLPQADPEHAKEEIEDVIGIDADRRHSLLGQDRHGPGRHPRGGDRAACRRRAASPTAPPRAMIVDSWFDNYVGVVMLVRVVDGSLSKGERIRMMATNAVYGIEQLGVFTPKSVPRDALQRRRGGLHHRRHQGAAGGQGGRHHHAGKEAAQQRRPGHRAAARLQGDPAAGLRRPVPDRGQRIRPAARRAGKAQAQRLRRCTTSPRSARRWASASAAASSACCTWRSCRSGWSASSTRT